jgi:hypothetical protein
LVEMMVKSEHLSDAKMVHNHLARAVSKGPLLILTKPAQFVSFTPGLAALCPYTSTRTSPSTALMTARGMWDSAPQALCLPPPCLLNIQNLLCIVRLLPFAGKAVLKWPSITGSEPAHTIHRGRCWASLSAPYLLCLILGLKCTIWWDKRLGETRTKL